MSIYDDTDDCSGTMAYGKYWYSAEPNAWRWVCGRISQEMGVAFFECSTCLSYMDATDLVVGDLGDIHCRFCGADTVHINLDDD